MGEEGVSFGEKLNAIYNDVRKILFDEKSKINGATKQPLLDLFGKMQAIAVDTNSENILLKERLANLVSVEKCVSKSISKSSYASAVTSKPRQASTPPVPATNAKKFIIKSKAGSKLGDSEAVKQQFLKEMEDDKLFIRVSYVRKLKDKSLIVEVPTETDVQFLKEKMDESATLTRQEPNKIMPRIVVYDLPENIEEKELFDQIVNKNLRTKTFEEVNLAEKVKVLFKMKSKHAGKCNVVIALPGRFYRKVLDEGRVFFGFQSFRCSQFVSLTRCYKCQGYGHTSKVCNKKEDVCGHCSENHKFDSCPNKNKSAVCLHCKVAGRDANHSIREKICSEFLRQTEWYKSKIDYD